MAGTKCSSPMFPAQQVVRVLSDLAQGDVASRFKKSSKRARRQVDVFGTAVLDFRISGAPRKPGKLRQATPSRRTSSKVLGLQVLRVGRAAKLAACLSAGQARSFFDSRFCAWDARQSLRLLNFGFRAWGVAPELREAQEDPGSFGGFRDRSGARCFFLDKMPLRAGKLCGSSRDRACGFRFKSPLERRFSKWP